MGKELSNELTEAFNQVIRQCASRYRGERLTRCITINVSKVLMNLRNKIVQEFSLLSIGEKLGRDKINEIVERYADALLKSFRNSVIEVRDVLETSLTDGIDIENIDAEISFESSEEIEPFSTIAIKSLSDFFEKYREYIEKIKRNVSKDRSLLIKYYLESFTLSVFAKTLKRLAPKGTDIVEVVDRTMDEIRSLEESRETEISELSTEAPAKLEDLEKIFEKKKKDVKL